MSGNFMGEIKWEPVPPLINHLPHPLSCQIGTNQVSLCENEQTVVYQSSKDDDYDEEHEDDGNTVELSTTANTSTKILIESLKELWNEDFMIPI